MATAYRAAAPAGWLAGGGEIGELMRSMDWSASPLGPVEAWPQSLKTTLGIVLNSRYPMFVFWGPSLIKIYNDAYRPITGRKHPWALGRPAAEVWPEIWDDIKPLIDRALAGEPTWSDDLMLFMERAGFPEEVYFTFSYSPIPDESGGIGGMFCACTESTRKVLGERRLRTLHDLAAAPAEARTVADACLLSAQVLAANAADVPFALLYVREGTGGARLMAQSGADAALAPNLISTESPGPLPVLEVMERQTARVVDGLERSFEAVPAGPWPEKPSAAAVLPLVDQGLERPIGALVLGISARRPFDAEYREWFDLLAGQIGASIGNAQAAENERARLEAMAELDRAKTAFFSNVSHEFRTPLTLMLGPLEAALRRPELPRSMSEQLEVAHRNGMRLLKLVNSLLDYSRIEAGRVQASYESTDLAAVTADVASAFRSACERAGLRLTVDCAAIGEPVYVDREMWEKIVLNLLSNAFKFTLEGGITVSLAAANGHATLRVRDSGVGIPPEELPRIFERFHRVEGARGRTHEGSGIGLALVQELVALHRGAIEVDSVPGRGSTFRVTVPLGSRHLPSERIGGERRQTPAATHAGAYVEEALRWLPGTQDEGRGETPAPHGERRSRILVVDDNADMRDYVRRLLRPHFAVFTAVDGAAALECLPKVRPDLVLSDIMMPGVDGIELLRRLRAEDSTRSIPVILLSARAGAEASVAGLDAGADDYLTKPFTAAELLARINAQLRGARLQDLLTASERRLQSVADHVPVMISYIDRDGFYRFANAQYEEWFGASPVGLHAREALGEEVYRQRLPYIERVLNGETLQFEGPTPHRTAGARETEMAYVPDVGPGGAVLGFYVRVVDITDRKRAEEALRRQSDRLRLLWEAAGIILASDDPETMLQRVFAKIAGELRVDTYFNFMLAPGGESLRLVSCGGIPEEEARRLTRLELGQAVCGTVALERRPINVSFIQESADPKVQLVKGFGIRAYACNPLIAGGTLLGTLSFASRTRDQFTADELEFLETISHYVTAAYRQMRLITQLRDADRRKDEFLATLAHELRNPLAPICTALQILRVGKGGAIESSLGVMERQTAQLTRLIDDLLDVSRITRGKLQVRKAAMDVTAALYSAIETSRPFIDEAKHRLIAQFPREPLFVHGDVTRLAQVFANLLSNAAKYTPEGGRIQLTARRDGEEVTVAVRDNGVGIPEAMHDRVFEMFAQLDRTFERGYPGLGIGLTLVKSLVEMHGGAVAVSSGGPGEGSEFVVRLPLLAAPAAAVTALPAPAPVSQRPRRVLVADDNQDAARLLGMSLRLKGHEVRIASDGVEAVQAFTDFKPDIVLLDLGMPRMNGIEAARLIRSQAGGDALTLVALTGWGQEEDKRRTREAGFDHHWTKPVSPHVLDAILNG